MVINVLSRLLKWVMNLSQFNATYPACSSSPLNQYRFQLIFWLRYKLLQILDCTIQPRFALFNRKSVHHGFSVDHTDVSPSGITMAKNICGKCHSFLSIKTRVAHLNELVDRVGISKRMRRVLPDQAYLYCEPKVFCERGL